MLNFYDFEVFKYDWLCVIINPVEKTKEIIVNDKDKLQKYYDEHKDEIWVGYNSRRYDQYILKVYCAILIREKLTILSLKRIKRAGNLAAYYVKYRLLISM